MKIIRGIGVSDGISIGKLFFCPKAGPEMEKETGRDPVKEKERFSDALDITVRQFHELSAHALDLGEQDAAFLFEAYAMMAEDEIFIHDVKAKIDRHSCSAGAAVQSAAERFAVSLEEAEDLYLRERAKDIRDVTGRILRNLQGQKERFTGQDGESVILAADDFSPSETIRMDKSKIIGFATRGGSKNSHTAILARALEIPAVCGLGEALQEEASTKAILDGNNGILILDPDLETEEEYRKKSLSKEQERQKRSALIGMPDCTRSGRRLKIFCNVGSAEDVDAVLKNDGRGIGLFRSEFLYLASDHWPDEEELYRTYAYTAERMVERPCVIRTLDIGTDKKVSYLEMEDEKNPAMGVRGIRFCFRHRDLFEMQLRAIYRANTYGNIRIMFPMITSVSEVLECKKICEKVRVQLKEEGYVFREDIPVGITIETPASVLIADELAKEVDFFSIGTNDLRQYLLAVDRQNGNLDSGYEICHPALLRALRMTADLAAREGIPVGICGELGADVSLFPFFLEIGISSVSVAPGMVLKLREKLRDMD